MTDIKKLLVDASPRPWRVDDDAPQADMIIEPSGTVVAESYHYCIANAELTIYAVNRLERYEALREAGQKVFDKYITLVNCGDAGFWNPENEPEIKAYREALAALESNDD